MRFSELYFNADNGYLEGLVRGFKAGILSQADYLNLVQCETLEDEKLNDSYMGPSARVSRIKDEFVWYDKTSDTFVTPSPWLLVNPNIILPSQNRENPADLQLLCGPAEETPLLEAANTQPSQLDELQEELLHPLFSAPEYMVQSTICPPLIKREDFCQPNRSRRKGRTTKAKDYKNLKPGCWPRPPVNYCILIALALKSSLTGSLKVQQIYNFTREQFPFFQTAPDGWKNTIRHNLCFNNSFRKTFNQLCRDGKRKSCFWHLTPDGHRRLTDEIHMLTGESLKQLERSMAHPDVIWSLLAQ